GTSGRTPPICPIALGLQERSIIELEMKVLHVGPIQATKVSGLSKSIPSLAAAQAELGASVAILNSGKGRGTTGSSFRTLEWPIHPDDLRGVDIVIFHSTFILRHALLAHTLNKLDIPYAI